MTAATIQLGLINTLSLWIGALALGSALGALVCAARMSKFGPLSHIAALMSLFIRGIPPLMWIFIIFFSIRVLPSGFSPMTSSILALGLVAGGYLAEIFRSGLEATPRGHLEAARALAVSRSAALIHVRLPIAFPLIAASAGSYAINLLKDTALASLIGTKELTLFANDAVSRGGSGILIFFVAGLVYLALSVPIGLFTRSLVARAQSRLGVDHG